MPRIRISDRNIESIPLVRRSAPSGFREGIHGLGVATQAQLEAAKQKERIAEGWQGLFVHGVRSADRLKRAFDVHLDRAAEEVVTKWETAMMSGLNGSVAADGTRVAGISSKTWADYEASGGKESPITDLEAIEKDFQSSEAYRGMSELVRKRFDRKVAVSRQRYLEAANRLYDRNSAAKNRFYEAQSDAMHERKVETNLFSPDADFEAVSREEAFRKMGRKYANLGLIANPEVIDEPGTGPADIKWKDKKAEVFFNGAYIDQLQKWGKGRCVVLANNAAQGEVKIVDGKVVSNEAQLKAAEAYAAKLAQPQKLADGTLLPARITPAEAQEIGFKLVQARAGLDRRIQTEISGIGANAIAQGDLATLEKANADLRTAAGSFARGSRNQTAALAEAEKVEKAADGVATYDLLTRLAKGDELTMSDGKTPIFSANASDPAERRYARLFPEVYESFTDKRYRAGRATENANAEIQMEEYAAKGDPQGYLNMLAGKVVEKKLSLADFNRLEAKFLKGWANGWKPGDKQKPKQMQVAESHFATIKDKLGVDLSAAFQRTDTGALKFDKNGQLMIDKKANAPDVEYRRGWSGWNSGLGNGLPVYVLPQKERFTLEEVKNLIDVSTRMALNDGAEVNFDPVTGERLPDGKTHKLNAVVDFAAFVDHLKDEKRVLAAADEMRLFAERAKKIDLWAFANGNDRMKRISGSRPIIGEDEKPERKDED